MTKTKKNMIIAAVALAIIIIEAILFIVLALPAMNVNRFFKAAEKGKEKDTKEIYRSLSSSSKDKVEDLLEDFATYECNKLINSEIEYEDLSAAFEAIIYVNEEYEEYFDDAYGKAASIKLTDLYEQAATEYIANDESDEFYELWDAFDEIYYSDSRDNYEDKTVDKALYDALNDKYDEFKADALTYDEMDAYTDVAYNFFDYYSDAYELASDISSDLYYYSLYSEAYDEAQEYYDNGEYMDCYNYCDNELYWYFDSDEDTTGFKALFTELKDDAYETGKTAYVEQIEDLAASDKEAARDLLDEVAYFYGDDLDLTEVTAACYEDWQNAYVAYLDDMETNLKAAMEAGVQAGSLNDSTAISYDDNEPEYVALYDFDDNGTPELILSGGDIDYVLTYNGSEVILTGCLNIYGLTDGPQIINTSTTISENWDYSKELLTFDGTSWTVDKSAYLSFTNDKYIVDGSYVDSDTASDAYDDICDYDNYDYISTYYIEDYETFILNYDD